MTTVTTPNLGLILPKFNESTWHDQVNGNFVILDAALKAATGFSGITGTWANATAYVVNDRVVDAQTFQVYICNVDHTSASIGTFEADRTLHPTYWTLTSNSWSFRGAWEHSTAYNIGDVTYDESDYLYAVCIIAHVSPASGTLRDDFANWGQLFDGQPLYDDITAQVDALEIVVAGKQNSSASLTALAALASTGLVAQTGANTFADRTITGTANEITVTNGSGAAGNPTLSLPSTILLTGKQVDDAVFIDDIQLLSTDAGAATGPQIDLYRNSASPAVNDVIGGIFFNGQDSAGNKTTYGTILGLIKDPVNGTEDAEIYFQQLVAGALRNTLILTTAGGTFNGVLTITG